MLIVINSYWIDLIYLCCINPNLVDWPKLVSCCQSITPEKHDRNHVKTHWNSFHVTNMNHKQKIISHTYAYTHLHINTWIIRSHSHTLSIEMHFTNCTQNFYFCHRIQIMPAKDSKPVARVNPAPNKAILHRTGPHRIKLRLNPK